MWQDRRTAARCDELREQGHEPLVRERTGLVLDAYFSATKIDWMLEHVDGLADRARDGRAVFGTIDSWLDLEPHRRARHRPVERLADPALRPPERRLVADELCELFGVPQRALPEVRPSIGEFGRLSEAALPGHGGVPLSGIAGDQQSALYGQACLDPGQGKNTYGTGSFVLVNTGSEPPPAPPGLLATVAWSIGQRTTYALEASIFVTGAAIQWLRDGLGIIESASDTEALAASLEGNDGVYFVPALTGLGSPHWDPYARGTIVGLTRGSGRAHLARAALEAIAYQTVDAVRAVEAASERPLTSLKADGGATANAWLMQFQADVLGVPVVVPAIAETTALGAALLAGVGAGAWTQDHVSSLWRARTSFEPRIGADQRAGLLADWARALEHSRGWAREA